MRLLALILLFHTTIFMAPCRADETSQRENQETLILDRHEIVVWRPPPAGPSPVVVFSHGYGGCPTQSTFLMRALTQAGYLVIAPRHADAGCGGERIHHAGPPFRIPSVWSDATGSDRRDDILAVLNALKQSPSFKESIDWSKLILMGHSVGGYTVLGLAGGWPSWRMSGIAAVVALSPTCAPFLGEGGALNTVAAPVSLQSGTLDLGILPSVTGRGGCFEKIRGPAQLVIFRRAGHFAWTDHPSRAHLAIVTATLGFLKAHVRGGEPEKLALRRRGMSEVRVKKAPE